MTGRATARGFSIIELLVSMAIGLVVTLAITVVMVNGERDKRSTTSVNDINQSGSYAAYVLDRQIRSAGSGFAQKFSKVVGCTIYAQFLSKQVLPRATNYSASSPFAAWTSPAATAVVTRLAPIIVGAGYADKGTDVRGDVLMIMTGTGGFTEVPQQLQATALPTSVRLPNTVGFRVGDLVLLADASVGTPPRCMVEQVSDVEAGGQKLTFGGGYYRQEIGSAAVVNYTGNGVLAQLGNVNANLPQFSLVGVGDNATLYSNDLLPAGEPDDIGQAVADGVVELRALYGVAPAGTTAPITWTSPAAVGYTAQTVNQATLHTIVAIRLGLVLRTSLYEKNVVQRTNPTLFGDLPALTRTRVVYDSTKSDSAQGPDAHYRYRTVELTIPLPNVISAP